jgi:protein NrfD
VGSFWPHGRLAKLLGSGLIGRGFKLLGCTVGFFVAAYTGALLTATNQPLWSDTEWIAPLFLTSAASTGIALLLIVGKDIPLASRIRLENADAWALFLELIVFLIFLASLGAVLPLALATWQGLVLIVGTLGLGLLIPLALHIGNAQTVESRTTAAAVCALVGGFLLRFGMVSVGPAILEGPNITLAVALPDLRISPEDERARGGGPGASDINRPAKPYFHNKISKAGEQ